MPQLRIYTAEEKAATLRLPATVPTRDYSDIEQAGRSLQTAGANLGVIAGITARLQAQADERLATERANAWVAGSQDLELNLFTTDPDDPDATLPEPREIEGLYRKGLKSLSTELEKDLPLGAKNYFRQYVRTKTELKLADIRDKARKVAVAHEAAALEPMADLYARNAVRAADPDEAQEFIDGYNAQLDRALSRGFLTPEKHASLQTKFGQKVSGNRAEFLVKTPEGRTAFYAMDAAGDFDNVDPLRLANIRQTARAADEREEKKDREDNERWHARWQDDYKTEIGSLITQGKRDEATLLLDHLERVRYLPAKDIEHLRGNINKTTPDVPSDPATRSRIMLDVEGVQPRTTEADIDASHAAYRRGGPGLNLADATSAKNQLRATRFSNEDRSKSEIRSQHQQAEQELYALIFGTKPDIVQSAMRDDPRGSIYSVGLTELRKRSSAYNGSENPFAIVEDLTPRVRASLASKATTEVGKLTPLLRFSTPDDLKAAWQAGSISKESYAQQLGLFRQIKELSPPAPPVPSGTPPGTPTPAPPKRKTYGSQ
jgi:hypothetical protein